MTGIADDYLTSWAYYQYKPFGGDFTTIARGNPEGFWNQDGTLQEYKVKALARAYLPYTQGRLTKVQFDPSTAAFTAEFTYSDAAKGSTVAYLNQEYWYASAPTVTLTANGAAIDIDAMGHTYEDSLYSFDLHNAATVKNGDTISM